MRSFDTCDIKDYVFEEGTTYIVWVSGFGKLASGQSLCDRGEDGTVTTTLLRVEIEPNLSPGSFHYKATVNNVKVPSSDTTYWCHLTQLPKLIKKKMYHLVRFEPVIDEGNEPLVHHMELFHCEKPSKDLKFYSGPCNEKPKAMEVCKKVIAAWAMGASPFNYPEEAGLPIGGEEFSTYVMLEIHYNNVEMRSDWVDNSGMQIYLTPNLRKYNAGVIELGLEYIDKMAIPPGQKAFELTGYCIEECISVGVPIDGIWIFGSQLHTHLTGIKVETALVKKETEILKVDYDNHYCPHYQEIRLLRKQVHVLPGDALITKCTYNTMNRRNITLGGFATTDEMCVNYIYYYPKINLEVCKSSISDHALGHYFNVLRDLENQKTGAHLPISESYGNIDWTPLRVQVLDELYQQSSIYMQCNKSNGDRFSGLWSEMPLTRIKHPLPNVIRCT